MQPSNCPTGFATEEKLEAMFQAIDQGDGIVTEDRLKMIFSNPKVLATVVLSM